MGIAATIAALQALHKTISGVTNADVDRPVAAAPASLPRIIVRPGALAMTSDGRSSTERRRSYEGIALVLLPNQGRGVSEGLTKSQTLMDAFATFYEAQIEASAALSTGGIVVGYRDGGEPQALLSYGADDFEGFTFSVDVWEG
jgi:hypothetical protein